MIGAEVQARLKDDCDAWSKVVATSTCASTEGCVTLRVERHP